MLIFANPAFLWALGAAAIPLMLHMFQRRRTVVTTFPTLRFLKMAQKRSSSRVRFENFLLWLLRTLLLAMLALAFAMPVIRTTAAGSWLSRTRRDVAIVIDGSYSMQYELDRGKVWEICKDAAIAVIEGLLPGDRVCVYLAADTPIPVIEKPTTEHATVARAVRALDCTAGSSRLDEAVAAALTTLDQQEGKRDQELYIMSDGQALAWQGFHATTTRRDAVESGGEGGVITREQRDSVSFFVLLAGARAPENAAPLDVKVSPQVVLAGQTVRINARIACSGPAKEIPVSLDISGENFGRRSIKAEADSETGIEFVVNGLEAGVHVARLTTPPDALAEDDEFLFLLRVREQLPAMIVGRREATRYLGAALAPGSSEGAVMRIESDELEGSDLRDYQAVFLCDALPLSGQAVMRLEEYVRNGGVVIVFPGDQAEFSSYAALEILPALPNSIEHVVVDESVRHLKRIPPEPGQRVGFTMALPPGTVPIVALKRYAVLGELREDSAVLVTAGDETPMLVGRAVGRGRVFLFTVSADREWSTFPLTAFFLPITHQLMRQGAGASAHPPHIVRGAQPLANEVVAEYRSSDTILTPSDLPLSAQADGSQSERFEKLEEVGLYSRMKAGTTSPEPVMAVNSDRDESGLTPIGSSEIAEWTSFKKLLFARDAEELSHLVDEHRNGRALAESCLWLALLLALVEWWFANRTARKITGASEKLVVDMAGKVVTQ